MQRGPEDPPPVSHKFSLTTSIRSTYNNSQSCEVHGHLATDNDYPPAQMIWDVKLLCEMGSHVLTHDPKAKRVGHAQAMIEVLGSHSQTGFKYLLIGDESWMVYN
jgi:hypothetical protein